MHKRYALILIGVALLPLAGCRYGCQTGKGWVFKTQGQIILGHTERLTLCPDGRFVLDVESDIKSTWNGIAFDPGYRGTYTIEDSDISAFEARIRLVFEGMGDFRRAYYRFNTESGVYLIEESTVKNQKVYSDDNWPSALKLR